MTDQLPQKSLTTPIPANETERLAALHRYQILDTPPEAAFDRITTLAARLFNMPIAFISLVDESRAWLKSCIGFTACEVPRDAALCSFVVLTDQMLIIPDTRLDERFACNPFVQSEPEVRFYAGAPLLSRDGFNLGTLCLLDTQPHEALSAEQQATLVDLAAIVVDELELRLAAYKVAQSEEQIRNVLESITDAFFTLDKHWRFTYVNGAAETLLGRTRGDLIGQSIWKAYPGLEGSEFEQLYWRVMRERSAGSVTAFYPDHERWYEVRTYPTLNGITVYFRNVTEQIQTATTLHQSEERYRTLFESIDEGFCVVEVLLDAHNTPIDYRVLEVNPTFEQQTGLQQAVGKTARQLNLEESWIEIYGQVALTGESVRFENGSKTLKRWFDVYACRTGKPEERKVAIVFKDISDRKQAEEISRFAAKWMLFASLSLTRSARLPTA